MEGAGIAEEDYEEFDMILGEIPNATFGDALTPQYWPIVPSRELDAVFMEHEKEFSSQPATHQARISVCCGKEDELKLQSQGSSYKIHEVINNDNLPIDNYLMLSFDQMSITDLPVRVPSSAGSDENNQNYSKATSLSNAQFSGRQHKSLFGYDATDMNFQHPSRNLGGVTMSSIELEVLSPPMQINGLVNLSDGNDCQHSVRFFKPDGYEPEPMLESLFHNFSENRQINSANHMAMPFNTGINYQLLTNIQGVKVPNPCPASLKMDIQSPQRHISLPGMEWNDIECESYGQFRHQYKYIHHFHNDSSEVLKAPKSMTRMMPLNRNIVYPGFEFPINHQFKECYQYPYLSAAEHNYKFNNFNYFRSKPQGLSQGGGNSLAAHEHKLLSGNGLNYSAKDFQGHQILDKVGIQSIPEKILTRSHGVTTVQILRPNSLTIDQSLHFDGKIKWSGGHATRCYPSNGSLQSDDCNYKCSPLYGFEANLSSKSMQIKYNSMDETIGRIYLLAKDQLGCRFLQRILTEGSQDDINKIFTGIISHIVELMTDPFGNYLVQKLLEICDEEQMVLILRVITRKTGELFRICCNKYGTRSVQKIVGTLKTPEHILLVLSSLEPDIFLLMKNINGNHVAKRCLQNLSEYSEHLMDAAISYCDELAIDRQGYRVLQTSLKHSKYDQRQMLMMKISSNSLALSKDPYGNYVVQSVLELNELRATAAVLKHLKGSYDQLSMQKYSSNVVEKCLKVAAKNNCVPIIAELMASPLLPQILQDKYGNYVMQSALRESKVNRNLYFSLVASIRRHASALHRSLYGKKFLSSASFTEHLEKCKAKG